jgi:hypothetical protein
VPALVPVFAPNECKTIKSFTIIVLQNKLVQIISLTQVKRVRNFTLIKNVTSKIFCSQVVKTKK